MLSAARRVELRQPRPLLTRFAKGGQIGVGLTPHRQERVVCGARPGGIAAGGKRTREPELRQRIELRARRFAAVIENSLEIGGSLRDALQPEVRLAAEVRRPQLGPGSVVERA